MIKSNERMNDEEELISTQETGVGRVIGKLRKSSVISVAAASKKLVDSWKKVVDSKTPKPVSIPETPSSTTKSTTTPATSPSNVVADSLKMSDFITGDETRDRVRKLFAAAVNINGDFSCTLTKDWRFVNEEMN